MPGAIRRGVRALSLIVEEGRVCGVIAQTAEGDARLTARENLAFFGSLYQRPLLDIDTLLDRVALGGGRRMTQQGRRIGQADRTRPVAVHR